MAFRLGFGVEGSGSCSNHPAIRTKVSWQDDFCLAQRIMANTKYLPGFRKS